MPSTILTLMKLVNLRDMSIASLHEGQDLVKICTQHIAHNQCLVDMLNEEIATVRSELFPHHAHASPTSSPQVVLIPCATVSPKHDRKRLKMNVKKGKKGKKGKKYKKNLIHHGRSWVYYQRHMAFEGTDI